MNLGWLVATLLLSCVTCGKVLELTDYTFDEQIEKNSIIMVLFYAPWCGKSKAFIREYEKAANIVEQIKKPYVLAKIDASSQTQVSDKMEITIFPTIKLFVNKQPYKYDKELTTEAVLRFIEKTIRPPSVELTNKAEVDAVKEAKGNKVPALYKECVVHFDK